MIVRVSSTGRPSNLQNAQVLYVSDFYYVRFNSRREIKKLVNKIMMIN